MYGRWLWAPVVALGLVSAVGPVRAQDEAEPIIVSAGQWAAERLPSGVVKLDPHRTGRGTDGALAERVARALGADLGTLEEMRQCSDAMDPSTCTLECDVLLAVAAPRVDGDAASVRVYAWHRQDEPRAPVGKLTWVVTLRRSPDGWRVVEAERQP